MNEPFDDFDDFDTQEQCEEAYPCELMSEEAREIELAAIEFKAAEDRERKRLRRFKWNF